MNWNRNKFIFSISRCLLGVTFVVSAILKFVAIEPFELYIYSFDWLPLWASSWLARGVLFVEFFVGLLLLTHTFKEKVDKATLALLSGFSLFLIILIVLGIDGNCHCMGETFSFTPMQSLVKNAFLFLLLYFATKATSFSTKYEKWILFAVVLASIAFSVVKLPYGLAPRKETVYNDEKFREYQQEKLSPSLKEGKSIVAFFSTKCKHCKMAMRKLEVCFSKTIYKDSSFVQPSVQWIVWGNEEDLDSFLEEVPLKKRPYLFLEPKVMMPITEFNVPLILFLKNDTVVQKMSNASFDEDIVLNFINE